MKENETIPEGRIMLHSCCAPCSGAILEWMTAQGIRPVVFFSNSNISTREEYDKRFTELERYCRDLGVELVNDEYNHAEWLDAVLDRAVGNSERSRELAEMPERGERCFRCFKYRLERAVRKAEELGCGVLTTSLASSRWKSLEQVDRAGEEACGNGVAGDGVARTPGAGDGNGECRSGLDSAARAAATGGKETGGKETPVRWWPKNWRKGGLQPRRGEIIREQGFYNQTFCGCEFSND